MTLTPASMRSAGPSGKGKKASDVAMALGDALAPGAVDEAFRPVGNHLAKVVRNLGIRCFY